MHLKDGRGRPVRPPKVPFWRDHFVFDGQIPLELPLGTYTFAGTSGDYVYVNNATGTCCTATVAVDGVEFIPK